MYKVLLYGMFGGLYGHWCSVGVAGKDDKKVVECSDSGVGAGGVIRLLWITL